MKILHAALIGFPLIFGSCGSVKLKSSGAENQFMVRHYYLRNSDSGRGITHGNLDSFDFHINGSFEGGASTLLTIPPDICLDGIGVTGRLFGYRKGVIEFVCNDYSVGAVAIGNDSFASVAIPENLSSGIVQRVNKWILSEGDSLLTQ